MSEPKKAYGGTQCKAMVTAVEGGKPYQCRLGVWQEFPDDGFCYMHHPKVQLRGGAAYNAIRSGDMEPKTARAKRRLSLKPRRKKRIRRKRQHQEGDTAWSVSFTEYQMLEDATLKQSAGEVVFLNRQMAEAYVELLSHFTLSSPASDADRLWYYGSIKVNPPKQ